jgi:hypothetical protein
MQRGMMTGDATETVPSVVQRTNEVATAAATAARSPWLRYGAVPVAVAVALLGRLLLWPVVGPELPYLFFWPAVVFAAWYGGLRPHHRTDRACGRDSRRRPAHFMTPVLSPPRGLGAWLQPATCA